MTLEEIKLRRLTNQHLTSAADKTAVLTDLCGLQAQFFSNAVHALKIRTCGEQSLEGTVKNWTLRGTVHLLSQNDLPLFIPKETYLSNDWRGATWWNKRDVWRLTPQRQKYLSEVIISAVSESPKTREELKEICRQKGMTEAEEGSMFDQWGGGVRELCERGFICYAPSEKKTFIPCPRFEPMDPADAELELARRYFTSFAPATVHDAMYFFHATASKVKSWLSLLPVSSAECEGKTYFYIDNGNGCADTIPDCIFLAGFDQLMLGYEKKESLFLSQTHLRSVFNLAGIVMPTVLLHGKVAGRWKKKDRKLTVELFEPLSDPDTALIRTRADSLWEDLAKFEIK
ncbi:MAG: AlkZ family DNA glycosylase [Clostridia bacterium]|nr:AlkZ family DNA glycosylase [Clostridia bacterium]